MSEFAKSRISEALFNANKNFAVTYDTENRTIGNGKINASTPVFKGVGVFFISITVE